jgi:hypothetical protein
MGSAHTNALLHEQKRKTNQTRETKMYRVALTPQAVPPMDFLSTAGKVTISINVPPELSSSNAKDS